MKAIEARALIKSSEKDYNAKNKMINSTVAWQAVQVAEDELQKKAIQAFIEATDGYFIIAGTDYSKQVIKTFKSKLSE